MKTREAHREEKCLDELFFCMMESLEIETSMEILFSFLSPPSTCVYLPDQLWSLRYEFVSELNAAEYEERMMQGWRRFGKMMFTPACTSCKKCQSIRVLAKEFTPNRNQRRVRKANENDIQLSIGTPSVTDEKLELYDRYHLFQSSFKDWPFHGQKNAHDYAESFVDNPFPVEEWCYTLNDELIAVGYVDPLPTSLSAIYFFYAPEHRQRSLGTYNILCILDEAVRRGLPYVCLGFYVEGCRSMDYKLRFQPNELLNEDGEWHRNE